MVKQLCLFKEQKADEILAATVKASKDYSLFVEKFKPKNTTDDCYTPEKVYNAVLGWVKANAKIDLSDCEIVRPFYPGGNYKAFNYPRNCCVIDNPPFSILSQILRFYVAANIRFFLFAPQLTLFSTSKSVFNEVTCLPVGVNIIYENKANVNTAFISNLFGDIAVFTSVSLRQSIIDAQKTETFPLPKYQYPKEILTSTMVGKYLKRGVEICISRKDAFPILKLDAQKENGKTIFGGGLLLSEKAAAEKAAAEKAAAEKDKVFIFKLSEREKNIIKKLG